MNEKDLIVGEKQNVFTKIATFLKKIFGYREFKENANEPNSVEKFDKSPKENQNFLDSIIVRENKEEIEIVDNLIKDKKTLLDMKPEQIVKLGATISHRKNTLQKKIEQLKNDIAIEQYKAKKQ